MVKVIHQAVAHGVKRLIDSIAEKRLVYSDTHATCLLSKAGQSCEGHPNPAKLLLRFPEEANDEKCPALDMRLTHIVNAQLKLARVK